MNAIAKDGYIDVQCYYSPCFPSTLLLDHDVLRSSPFAIDLSGKILNKYFELNNEDINNDLQKKGRAFLNNQQCYHMDYGTCTLTCIHKKLSWFNVEIPGIIFGGLCYVLPIEIPDLPVDRPRENLLSCSHLMYETDKNSKINVINYLLSLGMKYNNNNNNKNILI